MKHTTITLSKFLIVVILLYGMSSCTTDTDNSKYLEQIEALKKEIAELREQLQVNDEQPDNIISTEFAAELYRNYADTRIVWTDQFIRRESGNQEFNATRSLFYDLDSLENYIAYIRRISKEAKIEPSGLRFYFGSYSNDYMRGKSKDYAYRQTFFIAPTTQKTVGKETRELGYTLSDNFEVEFLIDIIGTNSRGTAPQKGSMFNFSSAALSGANSTLANELTGSPPRGNQ